MMNIQSIHVVAKLNDPYNPNILIVQQAVIDWISHNPHVMMVDDVDVTDSTLIIAVGGDGTMLYAMRMSATRAAKCIGINAGHVGFLTELSFSDQVSIRELVAEMLTDVTSPHTSAYVEPRVVLGMDYMPVACNDIVISPMMSDRMMVYELYVDQKHAGSHRANGVIVSTPTGSTAYSLSAGGSLVYPSAEVFQIVPIAPVGLTSRPLIVPASAKITISVRPGAPLHATLDGTSIEVQDRQFCIYRHGRDAQVVHMHRWSFFEVLSQKLGWNRSIG